MNPSNFVVTPPTPAPTPAAAPTPTPAPTLARLSTPARWLVALRFPALALLLALGSVYPLAHDTTYELRIGGVVSFLVSGGSLAAGVRTTREPSLMDSQIRSRHLGPVSIFKSPWPTFEGGAWRPYHFGSSATRHHHVVLPVWIPLAGAGLLAGWAFGFQAGARRRDPWACSSCGYGLTGIQPVGGYRTCPECGVRNPGRVRLPG